MLHENALTLLASGISSQDAISALLAMSSDEVDLAIVLNTNLKEEQIQLLIDRHIVEDPPYAYTYGGSIAILVASRLDLTSEQIWQILQSDSMLVRHAVMTRAEYPNTLFTHQIGYLLHEPWFTPQYAKALVDSNQLSDPNVRDRFMQMHPNKRTLRDWTNEEFDRAEREFQDFTHKVESPRKTHDYGLYFDDAPINKHLKRLAKNILKASQEDLQDNLLPELSSDQDIPVAIWLEGKFGVVGSEFYELFFPLLAEWSGSLSELASTANSLVNNQKATA